MREVLEQHHALVRRELNRFRGREIDTADDGFLRFDVDNAHVNEVLRVLADKRVENLTIAPPSLEELFLRHYGDEIAAPEEAASR